MATPKSVIAPAVDSPPAVSVSFATVDNARSPKIENRMNVASADSRTALRIEMSLRFMVSRSERYVLRHMPPVEVKPVPAMFVRKPAF